MHPNNLKYPGVKGELIARRWKIFEAVAEAAIVSDPVGLSHMGCPPDEYDSEIESFVTWAYNRYPELPTTKDVWRQFHKTFDVAVDLNGNRNYLKKSIIAPEDAECWQTILNAYLQEVRAVESELAQD